MLVQVISQFALHTQGISRNQIQLYTGELGQEIGKRVGCPPILEVAHQSDREVIEPPQRFEYGVASKSAWVGCCSLPEPALITGTFETSAALDIASSSGCRNTIMSSGPMVESVTMVSPSTSPFFWEENSLNSGITPPPRSSAARLKEKKVRELASFPNQTRARPFIISNGIGPFSSMSASWNMARIISRLKSCARNTCFIGMGNDSNALRRFEDITIAASVVC